MKKSLKDLVTSTENEESTNTFGAFTQVDKGQAQINLDKL